MKFGRSFACAVAAGLLSACASFPSVVDQLPTGQAVSEDIDKKWASMPAIRYVRSQTGKSVRMRKSLPPDLAAKQLSFSLRGKATVAEFVSAMEAQGIRIVLRASAEQREARMQISTYEGGVADFLEIHWQAQRGSWRSP